jgi:hypothetical protein
MARSCHISAIKALARADGNRQITPLTKVINLNQSLFWSFMSDKGGERVVCFIAQDSLVRQSSEAALISEREISTSVQVRLIKCATCVTVDTRTLWWVEGHVE